VRSCASAFVKILQDRTAARSVTLPGKVAPEPKELGQVLTDLHKKPGQLRDMLGGDAAQPQVLRSQRFPETSLTGMGATPRITIPPE
jgi:hypothetical protein